MCYFVQYIFNILNNCLIKVEIKLKGFSEFRIVKVESCET